MIAPKNELPTAFCTFGNRVHPAHRFILARETYMCPGVQPKTVNEIRFGEAIEVLEEFEKGLPVPHDERPGVIRAIEVLRYA
jgi:hypothetical protein